MDKTLRYKPTQLGPILDGQGRKRRWLAAQVGVSESLISKVIAGERTLAQTTAERIAVVLGLPLFLLFELDTESVSLARESVEVAA